MLPGRGRRPDRTTPGGSICRSLWMEIGLAKSALPAKRVPAFLAATSNACSHCANASNRNWGRSSPSPLQASRLEAGRPPSTRPSPKRAFHGPLKFRSKNQTFNERCHKSYDCSFFIAAGGGQSEFRCWRLADALHLVGGRARDRRERRHPALSMVARARGATTQ